MSKKVILPNIDIEKQMYLDNRRAMIDEFRSCLTTKTKFAIRAAIVVILQQEEYIRHISKNARKFASVKDEENVLSTLVKEAKSAYGDEYNTYYTDTKKERS